MQTVAITYCDYVSMEEEKQCKTEDHLITAIGEYAADANQYAPFTERVFSHLKNLKLIVHPSCGMVFRSGTKELEAPRGRGNCAPLKQRDATLPGELIFNFI